MFPDMVQAENTEWKKQSVSGSVSVYFPHKPLSTDTANQKIFYWNEKKDLLLTTIKPIPERILSQSNYNQDSILKSYINSSTQGANLLIYTDVDYKNIPAKFYKVRVDDVHSPIKGLVAESYNFILQDTLYSISYLRYNASELYDYEKVRMFFDMVEINAVHASQLSDKKRLDKNPVDALQYDKHAEKRKHRAIISLLISLTLVLGVSGYFYYKKSKKKQSL